MDKKLLKTILLDKRALKGIELYNEDKVKYTGFNQWKVESLDKTYNVSYSDKNWSFDCSDYEYRHGKCKHINAAQVYCKYHAHTAPKLTMREMIELEQKIFPHPISRLEEQIQNMKTMIVG